MRTSDLQSSSAHCKPRAVRREARSAQRQTAPVSSRGSRTSRTSTATWCPTARRWPTRACCAIAATTCTICWAPMPRRQLQLREVEVPLLMGELCPRRNSSIASSPPSTPAPAELPDNFHRLHDHARPRLTMASRRSSGRFSNLSNVECRSSIAAPFLLPSCSY